jgi:hypothetical protein
VLVRPRRSAAFNSEALHTLEDYYRAGGHLYGRTDPCTSGLRDGSSGCSGREIGDRLGSQRLSRRHSSVASRMASVRSQPVRSIQRLIRPSFPCALVMEKTR